MKAILCGGCGRVHAGGRVTPVRHADPLRRAAHRALAVYLAPVLLLALLVGGSLMTLCYLADSTWAFIRWSLGEARGPFY